MNKLEIISKLTKNHEGFAALVDGLNNTDFMMAPESKWTAGQQLDHIFRSVSPVTLAFTLPKFVPSLMFGKANRSSRDYTGLIEKYEVKLREGGKASGRFVPKTVDVDQKVILKNKLLKTVKKLAKKINNCTEQELDTYILPHPLLGKLTFREMLYFTIYHVEHHQKLVLRNLGR
ncbi:MAG: DinB family protein [Bacteroidota bacterium]